MNRCIACGEVLTRLNTRSESLHRLNEKRRVKTCGPCYLKMKADERKERGEA